MSPAIAFLALGLGSCGRTSSTKESAAPKQAFPDLPGRREANDVGRFLAGMPGRPGSPFRHSESDPAWKRHAAEMDSAWDHMAGNLRGMQVFQQAELGGNAVARSTVFYPFSGPDVLTICTFFPDNRLYILVGLEPAGTLPSVAHLTRPPLEGVLAGVRETLGSVLHRSFFITRQMDRQFRGQVTDGVLPAILELLVRTHHRVLGLRYVRLDQDGRVIERTADYRAPGKIGNKGVEIDFAREPDGARKKLFYFSVNLSDERLKGNRGFRRYLVRYRGMTTFFKSTSYMPHRPTFSVIRDQVMELSEAVLQDDSGLPFQFFDSAHWRVQLYGQYEQPYGSFRWLQQPDLRKAYETRAPKPMNFRIGYGFAKVPSNLLLARRAAKPHS